MSWLDLLKNLVLPDNLLLFRFLITTIVFAIAFVVYRIFSLAIKRVGKRTLLHRAVLSQIRWTLRMILIVAAFVPILWIWEIDLTALGLSLGIVAVAIGLASQNIVTNFLSGLLLLVERIYRLGDVIQIDDMRGRVIQIGLQGTKLWTEDNIMVSIPNAILAKSKILNMSNSPNETTLRIDIPIDHYADLNLAKSLVTEVVKKVENVVENKEPEITLIQMEDDWSIILKLIIAVRSPGWHRTKSSLIETIKDALDKAQIPPPIPPLVRKEELRERFKKNF